MALLNTDDLLMGALDTGTGIRGGLATGLGEDLAAGTGGKFSVFGDPRDVVGKAVLVDVPGLGLSGHVELVLGVLEESDWSVLGLAGTTSGAGVSLLVDLTLAVSWPVSSRVNLTGGDSSGTDSAAGRFLFWTSRNDRRV